MRLLALFLSFSLCSVVMAAEPEVRRGERVTLRARVGSVVAAVDAEALQDGRVGAIIRVRNLQNGKVLPARVIEAGQVEVTQ